MDYPGTARRSGRREAGGPVGVPAYRVLIVSWMIWIQLLRSSLELAWTSTISGSFMPMLMRNNPFSSCATSLTISFFKEITVDFWS